MTDINHRRKNRKPVNQRHLSSKEGDGHHYRNGHPMQGNKENKDGDTSRHCVGSTDFLFKGLSGVSATSKLADKSISAHIGSDFSNGHRGQAKAVAGAKKYARSRIRFHENAATKKLRNITED